MTENALSMEKVQINPEDPYLAYWLKTIKPIYGKETFEKFKTVNQNGLKSKYGLEVKNDQMTQLIFDQPSWIKQMKEWALKGRFGDIVEWIIQKILKPRTLKKAALVPKPNGIVIENDVLKFHNKDRRQEYYEKWKEGSEQ
ncbi:hypothetical protein IPJ72_01020 [Candidatus Peregrinibacteria bacterium]|nr:MAG: hypothetical protein IPJ72_01020 [Candidatus Peregrinibacteria bacterium]